MRTYVDVRGPVWHRPGMATTATPKPEALSKVARKLARAAALMERPAAEGDAEGAAFYLTSAREIVGDDARLG
jgi:hypothetical protein